MKVVNICAIVATLLLGLIAYDVHQLTRPAPSLTVEQEAAAIRAAEKRTTEILRRVDRDEHENFRALFPEPTKKPSRGK